MRILIFLVVIGAAAAGGWAWLNRDQTAEIAAAEEQIKWQKAALGMRNMLREHEVYTFGSVVLGSYDADGAIDFRGQMDRSGRMTPTYGKMRRVCDTDLDRTICWELTYLEADGQAFDLAGPAPAPDPATAGEAKVLEPEMQAAPPEVAASPEITNAQSVETSTPTPASEAVTVPETPVLERPALETPALETPSLETPSLEASAPAEVSAAAPPATHRVARALINTRAGPATENPIVTRLSQGAELSLLEQQGGWGRFIVLDGEDRGAEVWAALSLLEAL